nr:MAG TPA: tail tape measure protein [Caudoviricetes sp.]
MADIGTAYIRIAPNMTGIQGKIAAGMKGSGTQATKQLSDEVNAGGGLFQNALGKLGSIAKAGGAAISAGIAAGATGIAALTGKMLNARAELEQQLGGSEAVFGQYATNIQNIAKNSYKNMGLSQNEFLAGANKMGSLYQGAGVSVQDSMKMSSEAIQRATDVASIMGIDTSFALESVAGMAKGNFTMMDNLGVAMNDTALNAYALEKGIGKTTQQMSMQEKVSLATQMFLEKTAKYAGNYAKENETLSGSLNTTKKAFQDFLSGGGSMQNFITSLIGTIKIAAPEVVKILPEIVNGLSQLVQQLAPVVAELLPTLVPAIVSAAVNIMNALVQQLPTLIQVLVAALPQFIQGVIQIAVGLIQALPQIINILLPAIPTIVNSFVTALTASDSLTAIIMGTITLLMAMLQAIPIIMTALINAVPVITTNLIATLTKPEFLQGLMRTGVTFVASMISGITSMIGAWVNSAAKIISAYAGVLSPSSLISIGTNLIKGLWQGISNVTGWITDKIKSFGKSVIDSIKGIFGIHSPSKEFAWIGKMNVMGLAQGITKNKDMVTQAVNDMSNEAMSAMAGFDPSMTASVNGNITTSQSAAAGNYQTPTNVVMNITNNVPDSLTSKQVSSDIAYAVSQS